MAHDPSDFGKEYFDRFYEARATRVYGAEQVAHLAIGVTELIAWFGGHIESVLDAGAGTGLWRDWFRQHRPRVKYRSTDASPYACERYGHELADIATFRSRERFDLIICQGVLPYLDAAQAESAIANLGSMARGFLYLEAITRRDIEEDCDASRTDVSVHRRLAGFYRKRLGEHFIPLGCGLYYTKSGSLRFYDLERCP